MTAVYVGTQGKRYFWHINLICKESPQIAARLHLKKEENDMEASQLDSSDKNAVLELEFASHDAKHFSVITDWLYSRTLDSLSDMLSFNPILEVYKTACSLDIEALQNDLMDLFQYQVCEQKMELALLLNSLTEINMYYPESGMRRFLLTLAAVKMRIRPGAYSDLNNDDPYQLDDLFSEPDLAKELMTCYWNEESSTMDNLILPYHWHQNGSECKNKDCQGSNASVT